MKIKVTNMYSDLVLGKVVYVDEVIECTEERGKQVISDGFAEEYTEEPSAEVKPKRTRKKDA